MPIHVEEMLSEVTVFDGDMPLSEAQLARLVALVSSRLTGQQTASRDPRLPRRSIVPPLETRG